VTAFLCGSLSPASKSCCSNIVSNFPASKIVLK
jgi:hypothetical protein